MSVRYNTQAKALKKGSLSDYFTNSLYSCASYRGCGHGCRYCDGRAEKYYIEGDFEKELEARPDLPGELAKELCKEREVSSDGRRCFLSIGSGVTDVYQPLEEREEITRRCAGVFASDPETAQINNLQVPAFPVILLTKSSLILRDLELWKRVHERAGFILLLSITPLKEELQKLLEPGASSMEERWRTAETFVRSGIPVGILAMPLLPLLSDDNKALESLYRKAGETGVSFVMPGGLTLRPGRQKSLFLSELTTLDEELLPCSRNELLASYEAMYAENRLSGASRKQDSEELYRRIDPFIKESKIPFLLPHRVYRSMVPGYEALHILFSHMKELYRYRGIDTAPLTRAADRYSGWLKEERRILRRKRSLPGHWIDYRFDQLFTGEELEKLLENPKLAAFCREIRAGALFDYPTLSLQ